MTREEHKDLMTHTIWKEITKIREAGQLEYAADEGNVFANFERTAKSLNLSKEQVLWVFFMKHVDGISSYLKGHKSQREDVTGRITDAIVYLTLLWGMVVDDKPKKEEPKHELGYWETKNGSKQ